MAAVSAQAGVSAERAPGMPQGAPHDRNSCAFSACDPRVNLGFEETDSPCTYPHRTKFALLYSQINRASLQAGARDDSRKTKNLVGHKLALEETLERVRILTAGSYSSVDQSQLRAARLLPGALYSRRASRDVI